MTVRGVHHSTRGALCLFLSSAVGGTAVGGPPPPSCSRCSGAHFVDVCLAGVDQIANTWILLTASTDPLDCVADIKLLFSLCAAPNFIVDRSEPRDDSMNFPGTRPIDGHLDVIDTEIVSMCLTGLAGDGAVVTLTAGLGIGVVISPSLGAVAEQPGDPTSADSFFDVFLKVTRPGFIGYNQTAARFQTDPTGIDCIPPRALYIHQGCLELFDSPMPEGTHVANLVGAVLLMNSCPPDVNLDGVVNVLDLIDLLLCFGQEADPVTGACFKEDINKDGVVNVLDLIELLLAFGTACP